ncbi:MAG TPA: nucleotide exchange factor GrpE [Pseudonocardiaceae bacterium]|nr:nucleotide exchange factor GrpE [Pseudonocardiaceae bacterium]
MSGEQDGDGVVPDGDATGTDGEAMSPQQANTAQAETGPEPEPQPPDDTRLDELTAVVAALTEQIRSHHARAQARERVIDNLHTEVERLRQGERALVLRPVITDLQHLRTDLLHQASTLPADVSRQQAAELMESFALSAELALERCGCEPVRPAAGDPFTAREHRAVGLIPADRPEQDQTIGAVIAEGYRDTTTDRITVPAKVSVLRWQRPTGTDDARPTEAALQENMND